MPVLTVTNVSTNNVSAPVVGSLTPGQAKSISALSNQIEKAGVELTSLKAAGKITFSVADDAGIDNVLEESTLDNAGVDSIAAAFTAHTASTVAAPAAIGAYAALSNLTNPVTKTEGEALSTALAALRANVAALQVTVAAVIANLKSANLMS